MRVIYEPRGRAREYSPLAVNLYSGCAHRCTYCYVPGCLRKTREDFARVSPRSGIIRSIEKDAQSLKGDERPVLLCFTCDPYQQLERSERITRQALEILLANGMRVRLLTKDPSLAIELDRDLLASDRIEFGTTILFVDDAKRMLWEPNAPPLESRIAGLRAAHEMGLRTWVSLEPVIDTGEALELISWIHDCVDVWRIGRWNHDARANSIDWAEFTLAALALLGDIGARYYIKDGLWKSSGRAVSGLAKSNL